MQMTARRSGTFPIAALNPYTSDFQPRNHLYLAAGAQNLSLTNFLDTTTLPDGFHELAAVAREGTHAETQTAITLPIQIRNSSLSASMTLLDLGDTAPVTGVYHIGVTASPAGNVSSISLFSTGGILGSVSNQAAVTFTVNGSTLGAGRHPFYAIVQTSTGVTYRTETHWVRLLSAAP